MNEHTDPQPTDPALVRPSARIDPTVAHPARRYDFWLGGKDNFAADRASGDAIEKAFPDIRKAVRENRRFLQRAVDYLTRHAGIIQFIDVGTGLPTANNVHQVAQKVAPQARIVYADNDPVVLAHARALLTGTPEGATAYVEADLRHPDQILGNPDLAATLDLNQPVAVLLVAVLHFLADGDNPYRCVQTLLDAVPSGSYLALSHVTPDPMTTQQRHRMRELGRPESGHGTFRPRTHAEVAAFVTGLDLVDPGLVSIVDWRPGDDPAPEASTAEVCTYGLVARKP